jgi:hypothetical protein
MKEAKLANTGQFYRDLPGFSQFVDLYMSKHYRRVPDDWFIVICDLRGSTEAIGAGLYQNINLIGAACISTVRTAIRDDFPFVFGGDGASLLLPEQHLETACDRLSRLQNFAKANFGFDLRVCVVRVGDAHRAGAPVEVAKFMAAPELGMALIRGGGLSWAEKNAKSDAARFGVPPAADGAALSDLSGLSCRWQPLSSQRGQILSLLIKSRTGHSLFASIIDEISRIVGGDVTNASPASLAAMTYRSGWEMLRNERRFVKSVWSLAFALRLISILISLLAFRYRLPMPFDAKGYVADVPRHSDFRKFDDMLRMVLDCSPGEVNEIEQLLDCLYNRGEIYYGIHRSPQALITCFVEGLQGGQHVHFIDGSGGGYAMAAKRLKAQCRSGGCAFRSALQ